MKYVKQFGIILLISFAGEALNYLLPLPVPASIYGLVLMFLCLQLHRITSSSQIMELSVAGHVKTWSSETGNARLPVYQ